MAKTTRKPGDKAMLAIRMTESLRRKIEAAAKKSGWSINSELVRRLENSFVDDELRVINQEISEDIALIAEHVGRLDLAAKARKRRRGNG
ncbi:Arc family DNA-binding protein [Bradyrhizobium guangzhouense]|uniref:Arc family DNA-binding protein n=1 Tax=Bradyrhizobium guangzhouense TaxID=1325095 RepID=UPI001009E663|nr:Arc family DNA-binding protein [Bradyrhizobium guangzhouense]RXH15236.1 Arc family DNA-binding protein [Bradyrhizobium guangzhouense]